MRRYRPNNYDTTWSQTAREGDTVLPARATCMDRCASLGLHPLSTGQRSGCLLCVPSMAKYSHRWIWILCTPRSTRLGFEQLLGVAQTSRGSNVRIQNVSLPRLGLVCVLEIKCRSRVTSWSRVRVGDVSYVLLMVLYVFALQVHRVSSRASWRLLRAGHVIYQRVT